MLDLDKIEIDIPCPQCQAKAKQSIGWIKRHREYVCRGCGNTIHLDADQFRSEIRKAEQAVEDFKRKLGRLGR